MAPSHLSLVPPRYDSYRRAAESLEIDIRKKYDRDITDMPPEDLALMVRAFVRSPCAA